MDFKELVSTLENLTDECQRALWEALKEIIYRQKGPAKLKPSYELDCIVDIGLLVFIDGRYAVPEMAKKKIRKLYTYLVRKFDDELYYDPDCNEYRSYPKGAEFVCTVDMNGETKLSIQFPDDDVTAMLNLFGTNRCDNWQ